MKNYFSIASLVIFGATVSYASLIPIGVVPNSGSGLGAVSTILTFTSPGNTSTETGCVGAGLGGTTVTGSTKCPSATFLGGNEQAINNVYSTASVGFTNFSNFQLIFNPSEPASAASISLDNLALTIWSSTGTLLQTHLLASAYAIANADPGVGNSGWGFVLDAGQAAAANALLSPSGTVLYVGAAANASDATGGLETIYVRTTTAAVPEPGTMSMLGSGLLLLGVSSLRKLRNRQ